MNRRWFLRAVAAVAAAPLINKLPGAQWARRRSQAELDLIAALQAGTEANVAAAIGQYGWSPLVIDPEVSMRNMKRIRYTPAKEIKLWKP